jgi:branched-chain amino acid transport system ATP-binding protein
MLGEAAIHTARPRELDQMSVLAARESLLVVDIVHAAYGQSRVLRGISLDVADGEVVCLIGPNGAGKTTVIRAICGQIPVMAGRITWRGRDICEVPGADIVGLGIATVPEGRRIFPDLSVRENLLAGAYHRRRSFTGAAELDFAFQMFPRLKERQGQLGGTLSGGEQQMLAIARALMARPKLLLLDEPSMGLAPILIEQVFDTLARLAREGMTILLVEQNAEMALQTASRAYVLERGKIVLSGSSTELAHNQQVQRSYLGLG